MTTTERRLDIKEKEFNPIPCLIALMLFAAGFSIFFMFTQGLGLDEAQSLWQSAHSFSGILYVVAQDVHVPLYHFLLHVWQIVLGNGVPASRALSLLFYLPTIPLVYLLGKIAYDKKIGIWAATFFALSPFTNWYGSVVRMYSLLALVTIINQIFFILLYKGKEERKALYWTGYFISAFFGIYTHYFFFLNIASEAIFFFIYRKQFSKNALRNFIVIGAILFVLFVPWLLYVHSLGTFGANTEPKLPAPTTVDVFNTPINFLFGFQIDSVNAVILSLWPLVIILLFFALQKNKRVPPETFFFFISTIAPVIATVALSYIISPFYLSRYFIGVFPAFCLIASWFISLYSKKTATVIKIVLVAGILIALGIQTSNAASPIKEDYKDVGAYLNQNVSTRDVVALSTPFTIYPVQYYYQGNAQITTIPEWDQEKAGPIPAFSTSTLEQDVTALAVTHDKLWLVLSYDQGYQAQILDYFNDHFTQLSTEHFSPGLDVYSYQLRYAPDATMSSTVVLAKAMLPATASSSK